MHGGIKETGSVTSHGALEAIGRSTFYSGFSGNPRRNLKHKSSFLECTCRSYPYFVACGSEEDEREGVETKEEVVVEVQVRDGDGVESTL